MKEFIKELIQKLIRKLSKDFYKNPLFFYVLVPVIVALWPLFLGLVYLPATEKAWAREKDQYTRAQPVIEEILSLDPERLHLTDGKSAAKQFDYASAVQKVASLYKIPPASYKLASGMVITSAGQKSQSARVSLKDVSIAQAANFLSTIQFYWSDLQCNQFKIAKRKDSADSWDADFDFKYFF